MSIQPLPAQGGLSEPARVSFDQLDTLVRVTTIQAWVYLSALVTICVAAGVFAVVYEVPNKLAGDGILLIDSDKLTLVRSQATGRLINLDVKLGQDVEPKTLIGSVSQEDQADAVKVAQAKLKDLNEENIEQTEFEQREKRTQETAMAQVKKATLESQANSSEELKIADRIVKSAERLRIQRFLGDLDLLTAREKLYNVRRELKKGDTRLAELELDRIKAENGRLRAQRERGLKIKHFETKLASDREKLKRTSRIVSNAHGRVADMLATPGELVREGAPIVLLHSKKEDGVASDSALPYEAIVFVPAGEGKNINLGNLVEVSPATVKREEYGFIKGRVVSISELPATKLAMEAALAHPELVENFLKRYAPGVVLRVHVRLDLADADTIRNAAAAGRVLNNPYKWSYATGSQQHLKTGTICRAAIVVRKRRLISLLLPWVKTQMGVESGG
jgi:HlyD family secretion protein